MTSMHEKSIGGDVIDGIAAWVVDAGLAGRSETELLHGFCERCRDAGIDLCRAITIIDTLHPIYEGRAFRWRNDGVEESFIVEYESTSEGPAAEKWRNSPFQHLLDTGGDEIRVRLASGEPARFSYLDTLRDEGQTDYVAFIHRFAGDGIIGEMDCVYSYWTTLHPAGFAETGLSALRRLLPSLALALKCASLKRISETLVEVYLGKDAGQRVLNGHISRGVADKISAVLWFSDLRGYTRISDNAAPGEIIPLLNDYAEAVISAIHDAGGDVLKLIGDGVLAIFKADDPSDACRCALKAESNLRRHLKIIDERRTAMESPITSVYLGLHIGEVFYGNIGSKDRLDFTVVGPAVNEVSRIASMCRSVDRDVVMSAEFAARTPEPEKAGLVSVGRFALRGVGRAQDLFTLDPTARS
ncbi:adenylate cyclase [Skermanella aerolata]|uniref:adenylate/guanylate cyclase domain-containing protein n=1 Tax=Skermanella aerolata TaxID=393310 RepID=UPI003D255477